MVGWHNDIFVEGNKNWARTRAVEEWVGASFYGALA